MIDEKQVIELVALVLKKEPSEVNAETSLQNTEEWDSLRHLSLILALEDEFEVEVPDNEVQHLTSVALITAWLQADD